MNSNKCNDIVEHVLVLIYALSAFFSAVLVLMNNTTLFLAAYNKVPLSEYSKLFIQNFLTLANTFALYGIARIVPIFTRKSDCYRKFFKYTGLFYGFIMVFILWGLVFIPFGAFVGSHIIGS